MKRPESFESWEQKLPKLIKQDAVWRVKAYQLALFLGDVGWYDVSRLNQDRRTWGIADQLYRAVGSISANITEGYSRMSRKEKARFYEYALGSARESRDWYFKGRYVLGQEVFQHRLDHLTRIIQLLIVMTRQQRGNKTKEPSPAYTIDPRKPVPYSDS
jgi:four helix bundle protein